MLENKLADLSELLDREVGRLRDMTGTNLAGLRHLINQAEEKKDVQMFMDATQRVREKNKKKKQKEKSLQRAIMSI